ncbi:hypothetical protein QWY82_07930 [Simiduia curdlanivorans]|uniref:Uncharacterized protein n=1 Tax=Simiduia curdlanivorans TaxID=1492769 RepID=A0ABV8V8A0_9GAMM|nr:hypothetical protein [Simiduia curdlanivorans]MDN3638733.1 hypothetical protein [Simiduia curdlanivorans]
MNVKLDGALLSFKAPIHYPANSSITSERSPKGDSLVDFGSEAISKENNFLINEWSPCFRAWSFNAPWFAGYAASLSMRLSVLEFPELPEHATYFNAQAFKYGIGSFLESIFGQTIVEGEVPYPVKGPLNWKVRGHTRLPSASLEMMHENGTDKELFFFTPLERNRIVCFNFFMRRYCKVNSDQDADAIFLEMSSLAERIITSVHVEFNSKSEMQIKSVEAAGQAQELDSNFPPIQWGAESKTPLTLPI